MESFIAGIVSGLVVVFAVFLGDRFFRRVVEPKYAELTRSSIIVAGSWKAEFIKDPHHRDVNLSLIQHGDKLTGRSTHSKTDKSRDGDEIKTYNLTGKITDRFVLLTGTIDDKQRIGLNSFLFEIYGDGQSMSGRLLSYSSRDKKIFSKECELIRVS